MKTVGDLLLREAVWLNPTHRVETAVLLLRGSGAGGLAVIENAALVGIVLCEHLLGVDGRQHVEEVMRRDFTPLSLSDPLRTAANQMLQQEAACLPVLNAQGELAGMLTQSDLLEALRLSIDPLTQLAWADQLREWAVDRLRTGQEISILFVDVNDFGQFNKAFGHVVGDLVLRSISRTLAHLTDPTRDQLCRYGGDEFCIATIRTLMETEELAQRIEYETGRISLPETRNQSIHLTTGVRGGRRLRERDQTHFAAMVDDLINLASKDCMARKASTKTVLVRGECSFSETSLPHTNGASALVGEPGRRTIIEITQLEGSARISVDMG